MAESPQGLHDSRFSGSGPHTTTRGASAPAVLGDLAAAERHSVCSYSSLRWHQGCGQTSKGTRGPVTWFLRVFGVMSNHVGTLRAPMVGDFPASLTHSRLQAVAGRQSSRCSPEFWFGDRVPLPSSALSTAISLPGPPPFLPPGTRGILVPRAWRSRPGERVIRQP